MRPATNGGEPLAAEAPQRFFENLLHRQDRCPGAANRRTACRRIPVRACNAALEDGSRRQRKSAHEVGGVQRAFAWPLETTAVVARRRWRRRSEGVGSITVPGAAVAFRDSAAARTLIRSPRYSNQAPGQGSKARTWRSNSAADFAQSRRPSSRLSFAAWATPSASCGCARQQQQVLQRLRQSSGPPDLRQAIVQTWPPYHLARIGVASCSSMAPVSRPASICMMVRRRSPRRRQGSRCWIDAAPRQRGSGKATHECSGSRNAARRGSSWEESIHKPQPLRCQRRVPRTLACSASPLRLCRR